MIYLNQAYDIIIISCIWFIYQAKKLFETDGTPYYSAIYILLYFVYFFLYNIIYRPLIIPLLLCYFAILLLWILSTDPCYFAIVTSPYIDPCYCAIFLLCYFALMLFWLLLETIAICYFAILLCILPTDSCNAIVLFCYSAIVNSLYRTLLFCYSAIVTSPYRPLLFCYSAILLLWLLHTDPCYFAILLFCYCDFSL